MADTYETFAGKVGKPARSQGFTLHPFDYVFINLPFIKKVREDNLEGYTYHLLAGDPAHIIAHEIAHIWISDRLAYMPMRRLEDWKKEGYAEYVAAKRLKDEDVAYSFRDVAKDFWAGAFADLSPGR